MNALSRNHLQAAALAGFALLAAATVARAQENYIINTFDTEDEATRWARWWGAAGQTYEWDATVDADGNANSGSLKATVDFDLAAYGGDNQFCVLRNFDAAVDGTKYTNLVFDILWASTSPKNAAGNHGWLECGFRKPDWGQINLPGRSIPASPADQWIHVSTYLDPATPAIDNVMGVWMKIWSGAAGGLTGQAVFWVDNVKLLANTNLVAPPPAMAIAKATPGLQLTASAAGQQWQRQCICTKAQDPDGNDNYYSWVDNPNPVTYSLTIKDFPGPASSGFQAHIFLVPDNSMPWGAGDSSIDWNAGNVVFFQLVGNTDGTAAGRFMYKTNQPGGNSMLWNTDPANGAVGTLAFIGDPSVRGTWSLTFKNNTDITVTTPGGSTTNIAIGAEAAALFANPLHAYFGIQPNSLDRIGQAAIFSRVQITGVPVPLDDGFGGYRPDPESPLQLDTRLWQLAAADAPGIVLVPADSAYWLKWTAPATGFALQASTILKAGSWADPGLTNITQVGSQKVVLVPSSGLPSAAAGYFRLFKAE